MAQGPKVLHGDRQIRGFLDLDGKEIRNVRLQNLAADPGTPAGNGQILYRTDTNKFRVRVNNAWVDLATMADVVAAGISSAIVDAKGDLIVATAADTVARKAVGADGTFLTANSALGDGLEYRVLAAADIPALTGDVTKAAGNAATVIANDAVTNTKLANMAANTFKGNNTGSAADPVDMTVAQAKALLAIVAADISDFNTAVRTNRLDQMAAPTAAVAMNAQKITGLADGTNPTDAATFGQISAAITGQTWKEPVDAATTANITNLATGAPNTVDGKALAVGDRILVKNQTTQSANGIYTVTTVGTGANGVWARAADMDASAEFTDATVLVQEGTVHQGDIFTQTAVAPTVGTTNIVWVQTGEGNTVYTADGTTIELVGNSFRIATGAAGNGLTGGGASALAVNVGAGLEINADAVRLAAAAAGDGLTGGAGSALAVGAGNGITVTADAVAVDPAVVARKAVGALTGGANSEVITHNLNTRDVQVVLRNNASPYDEIEVYNEATTVNTVTVYAGSGYTLPAGYRYVVIG